MEVDVGASEIYEWRQFAAGERVRVRLSAECPYPHHPQEDGRTGTVDERVDWDIIHAEMIKGGDEGVTPDDRRHPYSVEFDEPLVTPGFPESPHAYLRELRAEDGFYAAAELEPLEEFPGENSARTDHERTGEAERAASPSESGAATPI